MSVEERLKRRPRADGQRNRAALLEAAQRHFLSCGVSASLEAIAKEAGVGPGTLYRHFPTREALLAEVLQTRSSELTARRAEISRLEDPVEALQHWLVALQAYFSWFNGLPEPLMAAIREQDPDNPLTLPCDQLLATTEEYFEAAQRTGRVRQEITGYELFLASMWIAWTIGAGTTDEHSLDRLRGLIQHGYRTP